MKIRRPVREGTLSLATHKNTISRYPNIMDLKHQLEKHPKTAHRFSKFRDITELNFQDRTSITKKQPSEYGKKYMIKFLLLGEVAVGKTSFIRRYEDQHFSSKYRATIGVEFFTRNILWNTGGLRIGLNIWDIAGNERLGNMTSVFYRDASAVFIIFDVTRPETLTAALKWKTNLEKKIVLPDGTHVPCLLIANKCDMEKKGMVENRQLMDKFVIENGFLSWFEVSAKTGDSVDEAVAYLLDKVVTKMINNDLKKRATIKLIQEEKPKNKCSC